MRIRKITAIAALAASMATTAAVPAQADTWPTETFSSYGECTRTLYRLRNERRQDGDIGWWRNDQYMAYVRWYLDCVEVDRNLWMIMRVDPRG
ncbi:hypothetical protein [Alteraurantiacibacter buctensis]|uniref:Secreted protein n=1 Tax=Alteraurantiacibacter buctensis TaxID=1503981 RepID=A0A844YTL3_9SPHN|nr:hypothetical protein [Alteraurantiacibacter buctensis]MXO70356.1 hypothetical protein [Alteraurantiacibacter buctensis]